MLPGLYDIFQERWGQSQSCYIYSDPHFNDDELAGGIKGRPSAEEQVKRINAKCGRRRSGNYPLHWSPGINWLAYCLGCVSCCISSQDLFLGN